MIILFIVAKRSSYCYKPTNYNTEATREHDFIQVKFNLEPIKPYSARPCVKDQPFHPETVSGKAKGKYCQLIMSPIDGHYIFIAVYIAFIGTYL